MNYVGIDVSKATFDQSKEKQKGAHRGGDTQGIEERAAQGGARVRQPHRVRPYCKHYVPRRDFEW